MRLLWLPQVLRDAGLTVVEMGGWEKRTTVRKGVAVWLTDVNGVVAHHTATGPRVSDEAVARLLREGRSDLAGPLAQLGLRRDGTYDLIAAGRCNHNGFGKWGNESIGIEAYNDGVGEPWDRRQIDAYQRGCAAICAHLGWDATRVQGHKETDPRRKIDPAGIDMDGFRLGVTALLNDGPPKRTTLREGDEGADVKFLQALLNIVTPTLKAAGFGDGRTLAEDGRFGSRTGARVNEFERYWNKKGPGKIKPLTQDFTFTEGTASALAAVVALVMAKG